MGGETLYNGIVLPEEWPPRAGELPRDPVKPSYLADPPAVIPIDTGRQLLVDDFLVERTDLHRIFYRPAYHGANPVLKPDRPWELAGRIHAMPFSDGVWFDPEEDLYRMWYYAGGGEKGSTCYAFSRDGIQWEKPEMEIAPWSDRTRTNIVLPGWRDSSTVWLDHRATDRRERFKMSLNRAGLMQLFRSANGFDWEHVSDGAPISDRSTFFYNPFRERWVFSIKAPNWCRPPGIGRCRAYWESCDFFRFGPQSYGFPPGGNRDWNMLGEEMFGESVRREHRWPPGSEVVLWAGADSADPRRPELDIRPQLYNLDCFAYESLIVGLFAIWRGDYRQTAVTPEAQAFRTLGRPKTNEVFIGFSRDGFHWDRPSRRPFFPASETPGSWNWGNVQSAGGGCLVVDDRLFFYLSGRAGLRFSDSDSHDGGAAAGLAILRRDGFAAMLADSRGGSLTTRPLTFSGRRLFVNADCSGGEMRVEILDRNGRAIEPFGADNCLPLRLDNVRQPVRWQGAGELPAADTGPVRFRFYLREAKFYSFWVSRTEEGKSGGYVAAGGPGFGTGRDE